MRKHYPGVERMNQTDRARAKERLDMADKLVRMVGDVDQIIDKVIAAARAYIKARGI